MACLRKRKKKNGIVWIVDFYDGDGKRRWFNTQTSSRKVAEQMKSKIEVDLALGQLELPGKKRLIILSKLTQIYLEHSRSEHSQNTYTLNERFLRFFKSFIGDVAVDKITRQDIENYKSERLKSVNKCSVNMEIRHLKATFSYAANIVGILKENPFKNVKQLKIDGDNLPSYLSLDDIEKLLCVIDDLDFKHLVIFYLNTGCRRDEALNLTREHIDLSRKKIKITRTKSGKDREIPITEELLKILKLRGQDVPFGFKSDFVTHKFKKYVRKAEINQHFSVHSLRHTFASHLVMSGVDLYTVQKLLGHSSIRVTEKYAHLAPDFLASGVTKLPY